MNDHGLERKLVKLIGKLTITACAVALVILFISFWASTAMTGWSIEHWSNSLAEHNGETDRKLAELHSMLILEYVVGIVLIAEQLATLFFGVMLLREKEWAVKLCRAASIINAAVYLLTLNLISCAVMLYVIPQSGVLINRIKTGQC